MHKGFACPSGYPVLLLPLTSQWHFIVIAVCKYSLQVRPSCSPEELTDCHVRECSSHFYSFSWSLAALDIEFQNFSSVQRREKAAGHKNSFETSLSPVSSYPVAAQSLRCLLPLVTVQMARAPPWAPPLLAGEEEQVGAGMCGPRCKVTFLLSHPFLSKRRVNR